MPRPTALKISNLTFSFHDTSNAVRSYSMSKNFIQKLMRLAILNILYRRLNLNETNFIPRKLGDVPFVLFRQGSKDPLIRTYHAWVKGILDAIDQDYLKEVSLLLRDITKNNEVVECYKFKIKYNLENEETRNNSAVKDVTVDFLRVLLHLGKNERFGETVLPDLVFTYNKNTPKDYEPPNFVPSEKPPSDIPCQYLLGSVNTGFHKLTCRAKGNLNLLASSSQEASNNEIIESEKTNLQCNTEETLVSLDVSEDGTERKETAKEPNKKKEANKSLDKNDSAYLDPPAKKMRLDISNITLSDDLEENVLETEELDHISLSSSKQSDVQICSGGSEYVSCICKLPISLEAISCGVCGRRYHMFCHGYLNYESFESSLFRCIKCGTTDMQMSTAEMANVSRNLAGLRLIVANVYINGTVPKSMFRLMDDTMRDYIVTRLKDMKIYEGNSIEHLNRAIKVLFTGSNSEVFSV